MLCNVAALAEKAVKSSEYNLVQGTGMMICALTLRNNFVVVGQAGCLPTSTFNPELGMKYAREDAIRKVQEFIGFTVVDMLYTSGRTLRADLELELTALKGAQS